MKTKQPTAKAAPPRASKTLRIVIVDDHPIFRQGITQLINQEADMKVCGEAEDMREAHSKIERLNPDLAIVDVSLREGNGLELIKNLKGVCPNLVVLVLSMHDESLYAERALRAGAQGYLTKQTAPQDLMTAIRRVLAGEIYVSSKMSSRLLTSLLAGSQGDPQVSPISRLSDRELEVFRLLGLGRGTREIAGSMGLSIKTVETYRAHIKDKLQFTSAPEMVRAAVEWVSREAGVGGL